MSSGPLCILTCASFALETAALAAEPEFETVVFRTFPGRCGRPPLSWDEVRAAAGIPQQYGAIRIFGGCCLASLQHPPDDLAHCALTRLETCFELVAGRTTIAALVSSGAYLASAGWLSEWRSRAGEWGFTRDTAREFFAESARQVAVLDTGISDRTSGDAVAFSDFVGRPFTILPVGLDLMRLRLQSARDAWQLEKVSRAQKLAQRQFSEYAMAFDLLSILSCSEDEQEVIRQTTDLYRMLFAARETVFTALDEGLPARQEGSARDEAVEGSSPFGEAAGLQCAYSLLPEGDGFLLKMNHGGRDQGVLRIAGVALPEHLNSYLNLALATVGVCSLALNNARSFRELADKNRALARAHDELETTHLQMLQQEKMASVGRLAAGVAHEINNPIGFITSNLVTLRRYAARFAAYLESVEGCIAVSGSALREEAIANRSRLKIDYLQEDIGALIEESLEGATRVKQIVDDLMSLAAPPGEAVSTDLNRCLQDNMDLLEQDLGRQTVIRRQFGAIPAVQGHPRQLSQVFAHLLSNAAQAMVGHGTITVRTWCGNGSVWVSVADTGTGIREEIRQRIFDPFFTTKSVGKGTGLGLSISYEIIHRHGGEIIVKSKPGLGSTFTIKLPG